MKIKKIIFGLSFLAIAAVCTINVQNSLSMSDELGYASLADLFTLNSASAEVGADGCEGSACAPPPAGTGWNGYGDDWTTPTTVNCCGTYSSTNGNKKS